MMSVESMKVSPQKNTFALVYIQDDYRDIEQATWTAQVSRYSGMLQAAGTGFNLPPVPLSTLGGWHPDAHRA